MVKSRKMWVFSRAKDTMAFVHSMPISEYSYTRFGDALRHYDRIINTAHDHYVGDESVFESPAEKEIYSFIRQTRFFQENRDRLRLIAQFEIGKYIREEYHRNIPKENGSPIKGQVPPKRWRAGKEKNTSPRKKVTLFCLATTPASARHRLASFFRTGCFFLIGSCQTLTSLGTSRNSITFLYFYALSQFTTLLGLLDEGFIPLLLSQCPVSALFPKSPPHIKESIRIFNIKTSTHVYPPLLLFFVELPRYLNINSWLIY